MMTREIKKTVLLMVTAAMVATSAPAYAYDMEDANIENVFAANRSNVGLLGSDYDDDDWDDWDDDDDEDDWDEEECEDDEDLDDSYDKICFERGSTVIDSKTNFKIRLDNPYGKKKNIYVVGYEKSKERFFQSIKREI